MHARTTSTTPSCLCTVNYGSVCTITPSAVHVRGCSDPHTVLNCADHAHTVKVRYI